MIITQMTTKSKPNEGLPEGDPNPLFKTGTAGDELANGPVNSVIDCRELKEISLTDSTPFTRLSWRRVKMQNR